MSLRPAKRARTTTTGTHKNSQLVATTSTTTKAAPVSGNNGKCIFIELPVELLLEIMSYFPVVPVPTTRRYNTPVLPSTIFERWDVLRTLSQTCRLWRSIFYPMLWERMEVCAVRRFTLNQAAIDRDLCSFRTEDIPGLWYKDLSSLLERMSKGLLEDRQAAAHVRTVNVSLTRCSPTTVLSALVECLENLPNLQTLQILRAHTQMSAMLQSYFEGHVFRTVQTVIVPEHGHEILRCCPEVRKVVCNYGNRSGGSKIISAIAKCCNKVEVLEGINADKNYLKRLAKACPNLRELKLTKGIETNSTQILTTLKSFKKLLRLEIQVEKNYADNYHKETLISQIIKAGKEILNNQITGQKTLRIFYVPDQWKPGEVVWTLDVAV